MSKNVRTALMDLANGVLENKETQFDYRTMLG